MFQLLVLMLHRHQKAYPLMKGSVFGELFIKGRVGGMEMTGGRKADRIKIVSLRGQVCPGSASHTADGKGFVVQERCRVVERTPCLDGQVAALKRGHEVKPERSGP